MSSTVIKVENLSKQYRLGARDGYKTFREAIVNLATSSLRKFINSNPQSAIRNPQSETIWALKEICFEVKRGEVVGIIGRNGAGKSTLLKILAKITGPTAGKVEIRGRVGSLLEVGTGFHPELTGHENIYLYGAILGMDRREVTRKFDEIVAFAELEKFIDTPVKRYSSGMYMRLAFAVAAHLETEILLVDEVLAVGDMPFQKKCLGKMGDISNAGRTVLFVSHNMPAVLNLCDRAFTIERGRISNSGNTREVVSSYLTENTKSTGTIVLSPETAGTIDQFYFVSAGIRGSGNGVATQVTVGEGVDIILEYKIIKPIKRLVLVLELWDSNGICVLSSTDRDQNPSAVEELRLPGKYITRCHIPGLFLRPGRYFIGLGATIPRVRELADIPNVLGFDVLDIDSLTSKIGQGRRGAIFPVLSWRTELKEATD